MRKGIWSGAALVFLVAAAGLWAMGGPARAAGNTVNMVDGSGDPTTTWKFDPSDITVPAGTTVKWHNSGQQSHTVSSDDGTFKSSSYVSPGSDFEQAFATAGTFAYHCEPHPWMKAVVHVTGGATATTAPGATTTSSAATATTATTAASATTTTKPGASSTTTTATTAAAGATTTTTLTPATGGSTATTAAPSAASSAAGEATTTTLAAGTGSGGGESAAGGGHRKTDSGKTDSPMIAVASVLTLGLLGVSGKLLLGKSRPH